MKNRLSDPHANYHEEQPSEKRILLAGDVGFSRLRSSFAQALRLHQDKLSESVYLLAGRLMRMRIVGRRLAESMKLAFAHLRLDGDGSLPHGVTVELWDETETEVFCRIGSVRQDLDLQPILNRSPEGRYASYQLQHSLIGVDREADSIIGYVSNAEDLSLYERGRPLHVPLSLWHKSHEMSLIHAGFVAKNNCGVLFAGSGGSGKSTSAITCASSGFSYLSDDLIGLEMSSNHNFFGHSLYNSTFMEPEHLLRFPQLNSHAMRGKYVFEKKHLVLLWQIASLRFERSSRIDAIVLPRVRHSLTTRFRLATKGEALFALAPSSLLMGERSFGVDGFKKLASLVERVPCFWLELGSVLDEIPCVVEDLLSRVAAQ
jgi:hypothetical protein